MTTRHRIISACCWGRGEQNKRNCTFYFGLPITTSYTNNFMITAANVSVKTAKSGVRVRAHVMKYNMI